MVRVTGFPKSGERGQQPPLIASSSSSSSTLSPLAPPFTVDRSHLIVKNPNHIPPPPPTSVLPQYFISKGDSVWSSSSAASRMPNFNSRFDAVEATQYYPYYTQAHNSADVFVEKMPDYNAYAGEWSGAFDLEEGRLARGSTSHWMDSLTCEKPLVSKKRGAVENFSAYEDCFGSWHGAHNESSLTFGYGSSEWLNDAHREIPVEKSSANVKGTGIDTAVWPSEGSSYLYSPETTSIIKECNALNSNSYDRYISQLVSCSRNPVANYPGKTQSGQGYVPSDARKNSLLSCSAIDNGTSVVANEILCENMEVKGVEKLGIPDHALLKNSSAPPSFLPEKDLTLCNGSALEQSIDRLPDYKFGFKVSNLSCCITSNSDKDTLQQNDFIQTSLEFSDHPNIAVDSPCWKGASMPRQNPFSFDEVLQPQAFSVINGSNDLVQCHSSLSNQSDAEKDGTANCSKSGKIIPFLLPKDLSSSDTKLQEFAEIKSNVVTETEQLDTHKDHIGIFIEHVDEQNSDDHATQLTQPENINCNAGLFADKTIPSFKSAVFDACLSIPPNHSSSSNRKAHISEVNLPSINTVFCNKTKSSVLSEAPSRYSSQGKDLQFLVKAMLSLSEVMLCNYSNDGMSLRECDFSSLMQTIDNLKAAIMQSKEGITRSCFRSLNMNTQPEVKESNGGKSIKYNVKNAICSELNIDKMDNIMKTSSNSFEESDGMTQAFAKILKSKLTEQEVDPNCLLYKNLWIQTEASLCSLKHDVALLKLEIENIKHQFKAKFKVSSDGSTEPVQVMGTSNMSSSDNLNDFDSHICKDHEALNCSTSTYVENPIGGSNNSIFQNLKQDDETDASVFARLKILKGRDQVVLSGFDEPQSFNTVKTYMDREKIGEVKEPIGMDVLQSHNVNKFTGSTLKNFTVEKLPNLTCRLGSGLLLNSKQPAGVQESHSATSDGSVAQSNNPKRNGKWLFLSCTDSSSSEWEHVLKDEFMF